MEESVLAPQINLLALVKRVVEKVLDSAGMPRNEATLRIMGSVLINIAATYLRETEPTPDAAVGLLSAFLSGTEEEQRAATEAFKMAYAAKEPAEETK